MPKPVKKEKRSDFMQRCIKQLIREGKPKDQAVAICSSLWSKKS